ncbi:unnamed protein product [Dovyalis caffra]|uniref:Uncharacterized protein n=1 Tax=Dovyalis caffra TaxID=77055 RepID=A0AAV1QZC7_9ROSI|nr:unnamed protein product [Dovyalis caffra]
MPASLEQLRRCHFLFMKWMRKADDAHWQQLLTEFDSDLRTFFNPNFSDENLIVLVQVVVARHQLGHNCSRDRKESSRVLSYFKNIDAFKSSGYICSHEESEILQNLKQAMFTAKRSTFGLRTTGKQLPSRDQCQSEKKAREKKKKVERNCKSPAVSASTRRSCSEWELI